MSKTKKYNPVKYYFIADPSFWPIIGSCGLFTTVFGFVQVLHGGMLGPYLMTLGVGLLLFTMFGWFSRVIHESESGLHSFKMDQSYRWGMLWFIVSEVALFTVFFFALFYVRLFAVPQLAGSEFEFAKAINMASGPATHKFLWPTFQGIWPLLANPNPQLYKGPEDVIPTWGIPALNTFILLSSAVTVTWAHWGFKKGNRKQVIIGLIMTILLGCIFESFQVHEYRHAYYELGLTLASGIYGTTFFTLTGLHAMHVSIGVIMLAVILMRMIKGHFLPEHHFGFEAVSWYWHFVDVVWLFLFVFVYWL